MRPAGQPVVFTVGHSTRSMDDFLRLLRAHGITHLVDVRRYPGSRRHPHFGKDALAQSLVEAGIEYSHEEALGGRRTPRPDSVNDAWEHPQFRGYADHVATPGFQAALDRVLALTSAAGGTMPRVAVGCAERAPEECHRRILSDLLVARGAKVVHLLDEKTAREHVPPPFTRFDDGDVTWPAEAPRQGVLDLGE